MSDMPTSGLANITEAILQEAREKASAILEEARLYASSLHEEAENARSEALESYLAAAAKKKADEQQRTESQIQMQQRSAVLSARQAVLKDALRAAHERLLSLPSEEYFQLLLRLLDKKAYAEQGELFLNESDLARCPQSFREGCERVAASHGGKLTISAEPASIDGGFILRYAGTQSPSEKAGKIYGVIEENCSFSALFAEKEEALLDAARPCFW